MTLHVRTVEFPDAPPLLDLLETLPDQSRFAYVGGDVELIGAGVAVDIPVSTGDGRGGRAWEELEALLTTTGVENDVGGRGTGVIAVGSLTFDPDAEGSFLVVPQLIVGRRADRAWVTTATLDAMPASWLPVRPGTARMSDRRTERPRFAGSSLRDDVWLTAVAAAIERISSGELEKVVLARDHHLWSETPFSVPGILRVLAARFPACRTFLMRGLLGASPEPVLRIEGKNATSRVLAGTAPRGTSPERDAEEWARLLESDKDRREHDMAVASVVDSLTAIGAQVVAPPLPTRLALDNVQHLKTDVNARLGAPVPALSLLDRMHPTGAVGGVPSGKAVEVIRESEGMARGRYAGPVGWTDATGGGEWALALRCAEVDGARARVFAGAGIVAGSRPEQELQETQMKLRAMLRVLQGLGAEHPAPE